MPSLNVITWNSTGESQPKADRLYEVIQYVTSRGWQPQAILVQEANAGPGGPIATMLANLAGGYVSPPARVREGGSHSRSYLLTTHASVQGQPSFAQANLATDGLLLTWIRNSMSLRMQQIAIDELQGMRMPAIALLGVGVSQVRLMTWHTPIGPGPILGGTAAGGANLDAYLFLQHSGHYAQLNAPGAGNVSVIAGDLNTTRHGLQTPLNYPQLQHLLPGFDGFGFGLQHILGRTQAGQPAPTVSNDGYFDAPGDHKILVGTVNW